MASDQTTRPLSPSCPRGHAISADALDGLCPRCVGSRARGTPELGAGPERFGRYELLRKLDEGGMGVVYEARQVDGIDRVVALKRMRDGDLADAAARRRFLDDARYLARLRHPHIVPVYEVGEHDGQPYFTMELMSGGTLTAAAGRFREPRAAAELVATLARAVHECHREGILHRDLKPANILFDRRGEPHIADFGIARSLDRQGLTSTTLHAGTVFYMAPEQEPGHPKRDTVAADIWSLGVILYELLAGRPFDGPTPLEVLRRVAEEEPEPLERLRPDVGRDLATICHTCLHKEPEWRYVSAEALADDLDRYLRGEHPDPPRTGLFTRAVRWCGRHPGLAAFFGLSAFALVTLTLWALVGAREQARARRDEVLAANVFAARAVAGTVLAQIREYADMLAEEARDPRLAQALARGDDEELGSLCDAARARHAAGSSPMGYWMVQDAEGRVRAHAPAPSFGRLYYMSYTFRDYFRAARALRADSPRPVYVSRVIRATGDDRYKIVIVSPIHGEGGAFVGLLASEIATDRRLGARELGDDRRIAALAVRRDRDVATDPLPEEHILMVHDGVAYGEGVVVESEALRRLAARRDAANVPLEDRLHLPPPEWVEAQDDYMDPLAGPASGGAAGPWLAGVAPVGHTELAVIVQTRLDDATVLDRAPFRVLTAWSVGGAVLLFAGVLMAVRARAGSRRPSRTSEVTFRRGRFMT